MTCAIAGMLAGRRCCVQRCLCDNRCRQDMCVYSCAIGIMSYTFVMPSSKTEACFMGMFWIRVRVQVQQETLRSLTIYCRTGASPGGVQEQECPWEEGGRGRIGLMDLEGCPACILPLLLSSNTPIHMLERCMCPQQICLFPGLDIAIITEHKHGLYAARIGADVWHAFPHCITCIVSEACIVGV